MRLVDRFQSQPCQPESNLTVSRVVQIRSLLSCSHRGLKAPSHRLREEKRDKQALWESTLPFHDVDIGECLNFERVSNPVILAQRRRLHRAIRLMTIWVNQRDIGSQLCERF